MESLILDLRFAMRMLRRSLGFTVVAVFTLAFGIGSNTAIFSVVNVTLLRELPFPAPDQLVVLHNVYAPSDGLPSTRMLNLLNWQQQTQIFDDVVDYSVGALNLAGAGSPTRVSVVQVTPNFFHMFGVEPRLGRTFLPSEVTPGSDDVAIIGDGLWSTYFGSDPGIVGRTISLSGHAYRVIGVMPRGFTYPGESFVYVPYPMPYDRRHSDLFRNSLVQVVIGRIRQGLSISEARTRVRAVEDQFHDSRPATAAEAQQVGVSMDPLRDTLVGQARSELLLLATAVGLILLIACGNTASLLLARAADRQHEMTVRAAIGASRSRLFRQVLTEGGTLSVIGGIGGVLLALWTRSGLQLFVPRAILDIAPIPFDGRVLLFAVGLTVVATILSSTAPAFTVSQPNLNDVLRIGTARLSRVARRGARRAVIVGELVLVFVLLVSGGLLLMSLMHERSSPLGFDPADAIVFQVAIPRTQYPSQASRVLYYHDLLQRLSGIPGVNSVGMTSTLPLSDEPLFQFSPEAQDGSEPQYSWRTAPQFVAVSPGYLKALGVPLIMGRGISEQDDSLGPRVVVISETLSRELFHGRSPIGLGVRAHLQGDSAIRTVVGVVADVRNDWRTPVGLGQAYYPYTQSPISDLLLFSTVAIRGRGIAVASIREALRGVDPGVPMFAIRPVSDVVHTSLRSTAFRATLVAILGAFGLVIAAVGVYGVTSYTTKARTTEFGVRMALGGTPRDVVGLVLGEGLRMASVGIILGAAIAWGMGIALRHFLWSAATFDVRVYSLAVLMVAATVSISVLVPVYRTTRMDVARALRDE